MDSKRFKYSICYVQDLRVTHVNGRWNGKIKLEDAADSPEAALNSCPELYAFLDEYGEEGWEMIGLTEKAVDQNSGTGGDRELYFKKEIA